MRCGASASGAFPPARRCGRRDRARYGGALGLVTGWREVARVAVVVGTEVGAVRRAAIAVSGVLVTDGAGLVGVAVMVRLEASNPIRVACSVIRFNPTRARLAA